MVGRRERCVVLIVATALLLLPLLVALLLVVERYWTYWARRGQAESYISQIETFKQERGVYPDPRVQTIVPEFSPYFYGSDGRQYCVGLMLGIDDTYSYCSHTREWVFGVGTIFDRPDPWPLAAAPNEK
jgi:hypothetical protein